MQEEIEAWLNSKQDYKAGVALYARYGWYPSVQDLLEKGSAKSEVHVEKLRSVLKALLVKAPPVREFKGLPKKKTTANGQQTTATAEQPETDPYLLELEREWKPLYTEMAMLHSRLGVAETDDARLALAKRITAIHEQLAGLWQRRDYYKLHGTVLPPVVRKQVKKDITPGDLRALLNARSARSQYKRLHLPKWQARLEAEPSAKNKLKVEKMLAKIAEYDKIIAQYEQAD